MSHYFENDDSLKSNITSFKTSFMNENFLFNTDNGVFSKGELDFGTKLLITNVLKTNISGDVLDLGCGYGIIGIVLKKLKDVNITMCDINKRAIHLSKMNAKVNNTTVNVLLSDGFENIEDSFDYIVSNPPIRVGKKKLYELITNSMNRLNKCGVMYIVIRKEQGALSFIKDMEKSYNVNIIDKQKCFFIISLKNN